MNYYDAKSQEFIDSTLSLDMSALYAEFEPYLKKDALILDLGCGPGRDLKYFNQKYKAIGLEPSKNLATFARDYSGAEVIESDIQSFQTDVKLDGIWACASLLHLKSTELSPVFKKLSQLLKPNGIIYTSFKYGDFEGERSGRYFTDLTEESIMAYLKESGFGIKHFWITEDLRPERGNEKWLNLLIQNG
tara:strand:- start:1578 stop:2147 length:570 start_codon:yes stop_codon:yes gene_type:complete